MEITIHEKKRAISHFTGNKREHFGKLRCTATMEITIHEKKGEPFRISREIKRADHGSRKYPLPPSWDGTVFDRTITGRSNLLTVRCCRVARKGNNKLTTMRIPRKTSWTRSCHHLFLCFPEKKKKRQVNY